MIEMKQLIKRFAIWLLQGIIGAVFVLGGAMFLVEWASGCGESYVDSKGISHANECVFFTVTKHHERK